MPFHENNIILDPFSGSGTTLVAAQKLGYNFVGIEIEDNYIPIINKRLKDTKLQKELNPTLFSVQK